MRINSVLAGLIVAASLAACGGGGSSDASAQAQSEGLNGTFAAPSGAILPDPATTTDPINVTINTSFNGQLSPASAAFTIPATIRQVGASITHTANIKCTLSSGQPGNGSYSCTGSTTLPTMAAGDYQFGIKLDPANKYSFNGSIPAEVFGSVTVTASTPK